MRENEWDIALKAGSSGLSHVVFLRTVCVLLCGILGIFLIGLFLSLGHCSQVMVQDVPLETGELIFNVTCCFKYVANIYMHLMWNFNFQITAVCSELMLREHFKRKRWKEEGREPKLRLISFGRKEHSYPL